MLLNQDEKNGNVILAYWRGKVMILSQGRACKCLGICDVVIPYIFSLSIQQSLLIPLLPRYVLSGAE